MTAIRFTKKPSVRSGGADYEVGQVVEMSTGSAARWLRRGVAVEVEANHGSSKSEAAAVEPPENAAKPLPRRRGKVEKTGGD